MSALPDWRVFPSREALAQALADAVAGELADAIVRRGQALLAVSGGSTPQLFFDALSRKDLDWAKVTVTLVDERFVAESSPRSNAGLIRKHLLTNEASAARFVPLYRQDKTAEQAACETSAVLAALPFPLDAAILGMGTDGHTASFFPDADNLETLTDPASTALVEPVVAPSAGEPRLTLPLARLTEARFLALHIEGEEKRAVLDTALAPGSDLPVSAVFRHAKAPVPVYWTP